MLPFRISWNQSRLTLMVKTFCPNYGFCSVASFQEEVVERKDTKLSKAMKAYVERSRKYTEFMKKEEDDFHIGKRHLANMMGRDPEGFSQNDIDAAIEYLFPSGLFDKKARPSMKPPSMVFPPKKDAQFDESGRPFHYLFYTGKQNFYSLMHEIVGFLKYLNECEGNVKNESIENSESLDFSGSQWISKQELGNKLVEEIKDYEYKHFILAMEWIVNHKFAGKVEKFILEQRKPLMESNMSVIPLKPETDENGKLFIITKDCPRKSARADVTVRYPGMGHILINGLGIEYFKTVQARNQILFPLELTEMKGLVDIEASVRNGGETGQAGAIRWGISWGLRSFVPPEMIETMRLAGLLTRDFRKRERKKPGQEKARKKFTWKKR